MNETYLQRRRKRKEQWFHILLGMRQMAYKPLLNLLFLPIIIGAVFLWLRRDLAFSFFSVPQLFFPIYKYAVLLTAILLFSIALLAVIEIVGILTARKDEADVAEAFEFRELRNGCPILMNKKRIKGSNVTMREFYSNIPMETWVKRQEAIADSMNVHFVEPLRYGGKANGRRIIMYTAPGRKTMGRGNLYDEEF